MTESSASKTALVFAGGGSLCAVQVGMRQVLIEAGISPDLVVGASVGAINGVHLAAETERPGGDATGGDLAPDRPRRHLSHQPHPEHAGAPGKRVALFRL